MMTSVRILVVEDQLIIGEQLCRNLKSQGYQTLEILVSAEEALETAAREQPDLVLMDLSLEGKIDGVEAAERIQTEIDIPVVFLTASSDAQTRLRASAIEPFGYIIKPYQPQQLMATIEMALHKHNLEKRLRESEENYRLLYERSPLGYQSLDSSGRILMVNQAWQQLTGTEGEDISGSWFGDFLMPESRELFKSRFPKFKAAGHVNGVQFELLRKDGKQVFVEFDGRIGHHADGSFKQTHCIMRDITARKQKEKNERFNHHALDHIADAVFWIHQDGSIHNVNKTASHILGYSHDELLSMKVSDIDPGIPQNGWREQWDLLVDKGQYIKESTLRTKSGELVQVEISARHLSYEGEEYNAAIVREISSRKTVEGALIKSEEQYHTLFNSMLSGFAMHEMIFDQTGTPVDYRFLRINPAFEQMTGLRSTDIIGKTVLEVMPETESHWIQIYGKVATTGSTVHFEDYSQEIDKWFEVIAYCPEIGQFAVTFTDITARKQAQEKLQKAHDALELRVQERTAELIDANAILEEEIAERKQAEQALRESEEKYRSIFESVAASIILVDREGVIVDINPHHLSDIARGRADREDYLGVNFFTHPSVVSADKSDLYRSVLEGKALDRKAVYFPSTTGGTAVYLNIKGTPLYKDGQVSGAVYAHENITELMHAEKKLAHHRDELEVRVRERTAELETANEKLLASLAEEKVLQREVHHRVKNNLQVICSLLDLQSRDIYDERDKMLFTNTEERVHAMALVHETLYRSGSLAQFDFAVYLEELLADIIMTYHTNPQVELHMDTVPVMIGVDMAIPCGLVMNELVSNAFKYAFPKDTAGKVQVSLRTEINKESGNQTATLSVSDNGVGLPEELDFRSAESLGLRLVNVLAQQVGAELEIDQRNGTTVMLMFVV